MLGSPCSACCCPATEAIEALRQASALTVMVDYSFTGRISNTFYAFSFSDEYAMTKSSAGTWATQDFTVAGTGAGGSSQTRTMSLSALLLSASAPNTGQPSSTLQLLLNRKTLFGRFDEKLPNAGHIGFVEQTCAKKILASSAPYAASAGLFSASAPAYRGNGTATYTLMRDGLTAYSGTSIFDWGGFPSGSSPAIQTATFELDEKSDVNFLQNICGDNRSTGLIGEAPSGPVSVRLFWIGGGTMAQLGLGSSSLFIPFEHKETLTVSSLVANMDGYTQNLLMRVPTPLWRPTNMEAQGLVGAGGVFADRASFSTVSSVCQQS